IRVPSRREVTSPAACSARTWAEVLPTGIPAAAASASTLRSAWISRSSSFRRAGLPSALPTRANWPSRAVFLSVDTCSSLLFKCTLDYWNPARFGPRSASMRAAGRHQADSVPGMRQTGDAMTRIWPLPCEGLDLADPARAQDWTRAAYRLARALLGLPADLAAYPTHGPGSFCSASEGGEHVTTIGRERAGNPLLAGASEDQFTRQVLDRLGSYPAYFGWMPGVNRRGAPRHGTTRPVLPALTAAHVAELAAAGATIVDARPIAGFAACHIPGSLSNELRPAFATWLGWLARPDRPLVAVLDPGQDRGELVEAALLAGYDNLTGELDGGIGAWQAARLPTAGIPILEPATDHIPNGCRVLDVRQHGEWASGHLPGALHAELGSLDGPAAAGLGGGPLAVMCGHGERAMTG